MYIQYVEQNHCLFPLKLTTSLFSEKIKLLLAATFAVFFNFILKHIGIWSSRHRDGKELISCRQTSNSISPRCYS